VGGRRCVSQWGKQSVRLALILGMTFGFYALSACGPAFLPSMLAKSTAFAVVFSILAGVARALGGVHTMHDASHGCWGNQPGLWNWCAALPPKALSLFSASRVSHRACLAHVYV